MSTKRLSNEDVRCRIDEAAERLDGQRAAGLAELRTHQVARSSALEKERVRLTAKYGETHPRVQALAARLRFNKRFIRELDVEIDAAGVDVPGVDENTWMIHGRVMDKSHSPLKDMVVALYDAEGNWIERLGHACTGDRGEYALRYGVEESPDEGPPTQDMYLTVSDKEQNILHRDDRKFNVRPGFVDRRDLILNGEGAPCPTPGDDDGIVAVKVESLDVQARAVVGEQVSFTATTNDEEASKPVQYRWDFGDGATAAVRSARHRYAGAGSFTVTFKASNRGGSDAKEATITVEEAGDAVEIVEVRIRPDRPVAGTPVHFLPSVRGADPLMFAWNFGDGARSTAANPQHTYRKPGTYTVALTVSNDDGEAQHTFDVEIGGG